MLRRNTEFSPPNERLKEKLRQMSIIYQNQSMLEKLRKSRAGANNSHPRVNTYSSQTAQKHLLPTSQANTLTRNFSNRSSMPNLNETPIKRKESFHNQSFEGPQHHEKDTLLHYKTRTNTETKATTNESFSLPNVRTTKPRHHTTSLQLIAARRSPLARETRSNSKNSPKAEKTSTSIERHIAKFSNLEERLREAINIDPIESKLESVLSAKSTDPQRFVEVNGIFDGLIEIMRENISIEENQKIKSVLRKIKLAYDVFFQNYTQHQQMKLAQTQEYHQRLEKECEALVANLEDTEAEIARLRKENERLALQNKMLKETTPLPLSLSVLNKQYNGDLLESLFETKSEKGRLSQVENMKLMIVEQQNSLISMKKKEEKLVKLLYACKQRGLDIEQIYYEDVKNNSANNYSGREDDEDLAPMNTDPTNDNGNPGHKKKHGENQTIEDDGQEQAHPDNHSAADSGKSKVIDFFC